ncbi:MAG TPA: hypothetical protein VKN63_01295 [Afifellaceae bacterium]|jgi:hypothetical protein|nr:hypothetical protein [Afifellaceae bacterium]
MRKLDLILLTTVTYFTITGSSYAYLDPGTGSIILQGIIGAIAGASIFARTYIIRVKAFFNRSQTSPDAAISDRDDSKE